MSLGKGRLVRWASGAAIVETTQRHAAGLVAEREREGGRKRSDSICSLSLAVPSCDVYHNPDFRLKETHCLMSPSCTTDYEDSAGAGIYAKGA